MDMSLYFKSSHSLSMSLYCVLLLFLLLHQNNTHRHTFEHIQIWKRPAKTDTHTGIQMNNETNAKWKIEDQPFFQRCQNVTLFLIPHKLMVEKKIKITDEKCVKWFFYLMWCWLCTCTRVNCRQWIGFMRSEEIFAGKIWQWRQWRWKSKAICICRWIRTTIIWLLLLLLLVCCLICTLTIRIAHETCK